MSTVYATRCRELEIRLNDRDAKIERLREQLERTELERDGYRQALDRTQVHCYEARQLAIEIFDEWKLGNRPDGLDDVQWFIERYPWLPKTKPPEHTPKNPPGPNPNQLTNWDI